MATQQLDRGTVAHNLDGFVARWSAKIEAMTPQERGQSEKSNAQSFWSDLLRQFGIIPERIDLFEREADRAEHRGSWSPTFERRAERATTGGHGYIDVFWSGMFIGEAKSIGKDLAEAEKQAMDYLAGGSVGSHEWPKYVIATDLASFRVTRLGDDGWTTTFELRDLNQHVDELLFLTGAETITKEEQEDASIAASKVMAALYTVMVGDQDEAVGDEAPVSPEEEDAQVQHASMFLTRLLFLLYGDDAGLWEADLFYRFILADTTADSLGGQLAALFNVLNTPLNRRRNVPAGMAKFPYVNGALFEEPMPAEFFTPAMRDALLDACRFRWTRISPAVFGSMFQMVKSREARRSAGEHYTTEANILKTLGPLFLDDLQAEADRLCRNASTSHRALEDFQNRLAAHVFLDPACGSGNFLTLAYARLRAIETQIIVELRRRRGTAAQMAIDATLETKVTIDQFHGLEISWWPAKIAETAMFLVDHQANRELALAIGEAPDRLPITITAHIHHTNALTADWKTLIPEAQAGGTTYVFGNPPFLGHDTRTDEQANELRAVWGTKDIGRLDYVTGWHAKSIALLENRSGEFAYVTTNSITQGDQVARLFGALYSAGWHVKFAHRTFAWSSEAPGRAAVHCVIVGFTRQRLAKPRLWEYATPKAEASQVEVTGTLNGYLVEGPELSVSASKPVLSSEVLPATFGNMPRDDGGLIVEAGDYAQVMADERAAKYVRPFVGSRELLHNIPRWCLWLVDMTPEDAQKSPVLKQRLEHVAEFRRKSTAASTRKMADTPYLFGQRSQPDEDYLCIPSVFSETRRYVTASRLPADTIVSNLAYRVLDPDGLQFALISSSMFIAWQGTVGGRLESRMRFTNTLTWHTFPVPSLTGEVRQQIIKAGQGVIAARQQHPERSLADAYNPLAMNPVLIRAHDKLDRLVDRAFGASQKLTTERQRLELLFSSYAKLTQS